MLGGGGYVLAVIVELTNLVPGLAMNNLSSLTKSV